MPRALQRKPRTIVGTLSSAPPSNVFLSYSHEDKVLARQIADALRDAGFSVWRDEDHIRPGIDLAYAIQEALTHADAVVFLMSKEWASSTNATLEVAWAVGREVRDEPIRIIPVLTEKGVRPPPYLAGYAYLDIADTGLSTEQFVRLVDALRDDRAMPTNAAVRSARRAEIGLGGDALLRAQIVERERGAAREKSLRRIILLTLVMSFAVVLGAVLTRSIQTVAIIGAPLTGLLGAAIGFYFRDSES
jgi:hypothetical protein